MENNEKKPEEKTAAETPTGDADVGNEPKTPQSIVDANAAAERIEKATEALKIENDRAEATEVRAKLGGSTEAGQGNKKPEEISAKDYAEQALSGELNETEK